MELTRPDRPGVLVCDYGGVLTNPLAETYAVFARSTGIGLEPIAAAFAGATARYGISPMAALEVADITEAEFTDRMLAGLPPQAAEVLAGRPFGELWFRGRRTNEEVLALVREVRASGHRVALLTNNVREWGPRWRATVPVDELFDVVVDSSEEGVRKPDPEIYRRLLARLRTPAGNCLLLDDTEENTVAAERLGLRAVLFKDPAQAIADVRDALGLTATGGTR